MKRILLLFIGIVFALFCLEILLQTSSFVLQFTNKISNSQKIKQTVKAKDNNSVRILCIGESTTYAQYPKQLVKILSDKTNKNFVVIDCGIPGTNIENTAERINNQLLEYNPDIVVTMIGINDASFNKKKIYKKYPIKIFNLFVLIKRNIENLVATKLYANTKQNDYKKIVDNYFNTGKGLETLINIVKSNPKDKEAFKWLIFTYKMDEQYLEVEKYANAFLSLYPTEDDILSLLTDNNIKQGKFKEAYTIISDVINSNEINLDNKNTFFNSLVESFIYYSTLTQTKEYYELLTTNEVETFILDDLYTYLKANNIDVKYYNYKNRYKNITRQPDFNMNEIKKAYQYIAKQIINNNSIYICMGYPTISIENFKTFFEGTDLLNKIYFVSNENNFNKQLELLPYYKIFRDNFAGTFGHCTDYGNELIAKNLAEVIIKLLE